MLKYRFSQSFWQIFIILLVFTFVVIQLVRDNNSFQKLRSNYGITVGKIVSISNVKGYTAQYMYEVDGVSYGGYQGINPDTSNNCLYLIAFEIGSPLNSYLKYECETRFDYAMRLDSLKDRLVFNWNFIGYQ